MKMKKNTLFTVVSYGCIIVGVTFFRIIFDPKCIGPIPLLMAGFLYLSGVFIALGQTARGKVCAFRELEDRTYTLLGIVDDVLILKYVNKEGVVSRFTAEFWPIPQGLGVGKSFQKVKGEMVIL